MPKTEMLINYVPGEESRIAIVRDGRLDEFYQERASAESHVGNIYQGKVMNVEPSIQAAFVDFGLERNGFLHISDLHPKYFPGKDREEFEQVGSKTPHRDRPPIQRCLRRGDVVLVQVLKEGIGTKGPTLTSYLSIPGRFLVMMPDMQRTGVSRKVEDDDARREMRKILDELNPPKDFGFIVRTAGIGQTKTELKRDLSYLTRLWKNLERRRKQLKGPGELYTESDLVIRTVRDIYTADIERIIVDDPTAARRAHDFLSVASPRSRSKVVYYDDPVPLYHRFGIEAQIESIHARQVPLPSGGSLIIDQAEALVAIDVNSGKSREARDAETNAYRTNLEAADEICRQLRLRDLGGVVVNDFIDMRDAKHRREVETRFKNNLKSDRARTRVGSISQFGLLEMTRQRMRPSLNKSLYSPCASCNGSGHTKTPESVVLDVMRRLALAMRREDVARIELTISPDVAFQLLNRKRGQLVSLERRFDKPVMVRVGGHTVDFVAISAADNRGGAIDPEALGTTDGLADEHHEKMFREITGQPSDFELLDEEEPAEAGPDVEAILSGQVPVEQDDHGLEDEDETTKQASQADGQGGEGGGRKRRRRRRRRGGRGRDRDAADVAMDQARMPDAPSVEPAAQDDETQEMQEAVEMAQEDEPSTPRRSERASRSNEPLDSTGTWEGGLETEETPSASRSEHPHGDDATAHIDREDAAEAAGDHGDGDEDRDDAEPGSGDEAGAVGDATGHAQGEDQAGGRRRRRRRRGGRGRRKGNGGGQPDGNAAADESGNGHVNGEAAPIKAQNSPRPPQPQQPKGPQPRPQQPQGRNQAGQPRPPRQQPPRPQPSPRPQQAPRAGGEQPPVVSAGYSNRVVEVNEDNRGNQRGNDE